MARPPASSPAFSVAVIVDTVSGPIAREDVQAVIDEAGRLLRELTPFNIEMTELVEDDSGGSIDDMAHRYISSHTAALPNGIIVFSYGASAQALVHGLDGYSLSAPPGFQNSFVSPALGETRIYLAVVNFGNKYAACGYGGLAAAASSTSLEGECRNKPGTTCVQHNGYSMCADSIGHLYASTPTYHISSSIIHQLLHSFGEGGEGDHYSTPECTARMGYPPGFFDLQESQYNNDLCPHVYEEFAKSHFP